MGLPKIGVEKRGVIFSFYMLVFMVFLVFKLNSVFEYLILLVLVFSSMIVGVFADYSYLKKNNFINELGLEYLEEK